MHSFFDLTHFRELGPKYKNIFVWYLVQMKTSKFAFKINWPLKQNASKEISTFETLPSTKNFASSFNQSQDSFKLPLLHKSWLEKYTNQAKNDTETWRFILTIWLCDMKNKNVINTFVMEFPMTWSTLFLSRWTGIIYFSMTEMKI